VPAVASTQKRNRRNGILSISPLEVSNLESPVFPPPGAVGRCWHIECPAMVGRTGPPSDIHLEFRPDLSPHEMKEPQQKQLTVSRWRPLLAAQTAWLIVYGEKMF